MSPTPRMESTTRAGSVFCAKPATGKSASKKKARASLRGRLALRMRE